MTDDKSFFEDEIPKAVDELIVHRSNLALQVNRRRYILQQVLKWVSVPATAMAGIAIFFKLKETEQPENDQLTLLLDWPEEDALEIELAMEDDLEIIENLDILENWEES